MSSPQPAMEMCDRIVPDAAREYLTDSNEALQFTLGQWLYSFSSYVKGKLRIQPPQPPVKYPRIMSGNDQSYYC